MDIKGFVKPEIIKFVWFKTCNAIFDYSINYLHLERTNIVKNALIKQNFI